MIKKPPPEFVRGGGLGKPRPHLSGIGTFPACGRLPGLQRASPSTPLDVSSCVQLCRATLARLRRGAKAQVDCLSERILMLTTMTPDEPRSPDAQPAQATPQAYGADTRRGRDTSIRA